MNLKKFIFYPVYLVSVICILSCASNPPPKKEAFSLEVQTREIESSKRVKEMNEKLLMSSLSSRRDFYRDYKIGPEDLLEISVFEDEKLNKAVRVSSQGNISLPLLGVLKVKSLTANELEKEIRDLLAEKYFQDPHVSVFIKEYRNQRISVIGAVERPGVYDVTGQKTVLDLLAIGGGLKADSGQLLFLIRPSGLEEAIPKENRESDDQTPKTFMIDLERLLVKGDLTLNLPLVHGDVVNVPVSGKVFVGGEVKIPGGFSLTGKKLTLSQAITLAGGLKPQAAGSETKVFRYKENSEKGTDREILSVNVYAIQQGQGEDPALKENDIIFIPTHGFKNFLIEFRNTVSGLVGFGFSLGGL
jgi:polysaccharide export outer membrane protein